MLVFDGSIKNWKEEHNVANEVVLFKFLYDFEDVVRSCEAQFNAGPLHLHFGYGAH